MKDHKAVEVSGKEDGPPDFLGSRMFFSSIIRGLRPSGECTSWRYDTYAAVEAIWLRKPPPELCWTGAACCIGVAWLGCAAVE